MKKFFLLIFILIIVVIDIYMAKQILLNIHKEELPKIKNEEKKQIITESPVKEKMEEVVNTEKNETQPVQPPSEENKPVVEQKEAKEKVETAQPKEKQEEKNSEENKIEEAPQQIPEGYMVANVYVNLRKEPDVNSEVVTVIKKGATVKIIGKKAKHWKRVLYTSENRVYEGWVDDRFFTAGEVQEKR